MRKSYRFWQGLAALSLVFLPLLLLWCAWRNPPYKALLLFLGVSLSCVPFFFTFEAERPTAAQLMPLIILAAAAAAGRVLFAAVPNFKPVTAIVIIAGVTLGKNQGFLCGALAALASNLFFGQGAWTPWQMYAWGLVGYVGGVLGEKDLLSRAPVLYGWGLLSGLVYGLILNGYHVLGYVQPLAWPAVVAACAVSLPLDVTHGVATVAFLAAIWLPWGRAIRRVVAKYDL